MDAPVPVYAADREEWRAWLEANHQNAREVWLVYYKKGSSQPSVSYEAAVEEALCFGWIDGLTRGMDEARYMQRFTPRRKGSNWSDPNKRRVRKLIAEGRMTPAGLAAVTFPLDEVGDAES